MSMQAPIGLFFGSFNPIHNGHMAIANYMLEYTPIRQLWFVVSPQNPFKQQAGLLPEYQRLQLVRLAIGDFPGFRASNIEFGLAKPSYTIDTLIYLEEKHPDQQFAILLGSDGLPGFHKWKNFSLLLERYDLFVYPRPGFPPEPKAYPGITDWSRVHFTEAPVMEISSSFIRNGLRAGKRMDFFMPPAVSKYIDEMHFYAQ